MKMKSKVRVVAALLLGAVLSASMIGCDAQQTAAELVDTLGLAATSLLVFEGKASDATQLQADVTAASAAIANWKNGTPAQDVVEALNLVEDDLNLIPISTEDQALIDLGIGTVDQILALFPGATAAPATTTAAKPAATLVSWQAAQPGGTSRQHVPHRTVHLAKTPKNAKEFKALWNAQAKPLGKPLVK